VGVVLGYDGSSCSRPAPTMPKHGSAVGAIACLLNIRQFVIVGTSVNPAPKIDLSKYSWQHLRGQRRPCFVFSQIDQTIAATLLTLSANANTVCQCVLTHSIAAAVDVRSDLPGHAHRPRVSALFTPPILSEAKRTARARVVAGVCSAVSSSREWRRGSRYVGVERQSKIDAYRSATTCRCPGQ
jgi:hypothetical protein